MRGLLAVLVIAGAGVALCLQPVWYVHGASGARFPGELDWVWIWNSPLIGGFDAVWTDPIVIPRPPGVPPPRSYYPAVAWPVAAAQGAVVLLLLSCALLGLRRWRLATEPEAAAPREPVFMPAARGVAAVAAAARDRYAAIGVGRRRLVWFALCVLATSVLWAAPPVRRVGTLSAKQLRRVELILSDPDARGALSEPELASMRTALAQGGQTTGDHGWIARHRWGHWWRREDGPHHDPAGFAHEEVRWGTLLWEQLLLLALAGAGLLAVGRRPTPRA